MREELKKRTGEVESIVDSYLPAEEGYQKTIFEAMNYSVRAGGKRLRPMLMEETYRLFGGTEKASGKCWRRVCITLIYLQTYDVLGEDVHSVRKYEGKIN